MAEGMESAEKLGNCLYSESESNRKQVEITVINNLYT